MCVLNYLFSFSRNQFPTKPLQSLFRISFTYCPFAGAVSVLLIGILMSYLTGKSKSESMNPDVFCPLTQSILHKSLIRSPTASLEARPNTQEVYVALDEALKHLKEVIDRWLNGVKCFFFPFYLLHRIWRYKCRIEWDVRKTNNPPQTLLIFL